MHNKKPMNEEQMNRIRELIGNLQNQFIEQQKPFEPVLLSLENSLQRTKALAFKLYREKCKESFEELEHYVSIDKNAEMFLKKDDTDFKQVKAEINKVNKCIEDLNSDYAAVSKKVKVERKRYSVMYMKCNEDCLKDAPNQSDQQISDCLVSCNKDMLEKYDTVAKELLKDYKNLVSGLEKML